MVVAQGEHECRWRRLRLPAGVKVQEAEVTQAEPKLLKDANKQPANTYLGTTGQTISNCVHIIKFVFCIMLT